MGQARFSLRGRPYIISLVTLVLAIVVVPSARLGYLGGMVYYVALAAAVFGATKSRWVRRATVVYALLSTVAHFGNAASQSPISEPVVFLLDLAFALFTPVIVVRNVLSGTTASTHDYAGALVSYLLIGVFFGFAHAMVESFVPGSYSGIAANTSDAHVWRLTYFSFVTLTTLGYGDVAPVSRLAEGLSILEAAAGQSYIAILIAHLVARPRAPRPAETPEPVEAD